MLVRGRGERGEVRTLMSDYAELELPEHRQVDKDLGICPVCRGLLANLRATVEALGRLAPSSPPSSAEDVETVAERIARPWGNTRESSGSSRRGRDAWAERFERSGEPCAYRPSQTRTPRLGD